MESSLLCTSLSTKRQIWESGFGHLSCNLVDRAHRFAARQYIQPVACSLVTKGAYTFAGCFYAALGAIGHIYIIQSKYTTVGVFQSRLHVPV